MFKILFFGATAEIAGSRSLEADESDYLDSGAVLERMKKTYPGLAGHRLFLAVNQQHAAGTEPIRSGDEVAIFTAVSGG